MRHAPLLVVFGLLGCGPGGARPDDESSELESTSDESSGSTSTSESTDESTSESETLADTDSTTGEDPACPQTLVGLLEITDETDLSTLACLVEAQWVDIEGSFTDLSFLATLEVVESLDIREAPALTSLAGLESLHDVGWLGLRDVPNIVDLSSLPSDVLIDTLMIASGNDSLMSIAMPPGGATHLVFGGWDRPNLEILATASPAPDHLQISSPLLEDLEDIAACCVDQQATLDLELTDTPLLTHLQGLESFTMLSSLWLTYNPSVESFAGLQNLQVVGDIYIENGCVPDPQAKLVDFSGLEQLVELGSLRVHSQGALASLDGLPTQLTVSWVSLVNNPALDQSLIDAWAAAAMPDAIEGCDNLNGPACEGLCPQ